MKTHNRETINNAIEACRSKEPIEILGAKFMIVDIDVSYGHKEYINHEYTAFIELVEVFD